MRPKAGSSSSRRVRANRPNHLIYMGLDSIPSGFRKEIPVDFQALSTVRYRISD